MVAFKRKAICILTFVLTFFERRKKSNLAKTSEVRWGGFYLRLNFLLLVRATNHKMFNGAAEGFSHR